MLSNGVDAVDLPGVEHEDGRVLFVSRMEREKGVLDAISVLQALAERGSAGARRHGRWRQSRARGAPCSGSRVGGRIEYLGALDREALNHEYARAAIVVMPSRFEGLGMVALEAQAAGTPVVGFDVDGLRDAVGAGGVLVPAGDLLALRDAASDNCSTTPARRAEAGRARARGRARRALLGRRSARASRRSIAP